MPSTSLKTIRISGMLLLFFGSVEVLGIDLIVAFVAGFAGDNIVDDDSTVPNNNSATRMAKLKQSGMTLLVLSMIGDLMPSCCSRFKGLVVPLCRPPLSLLLPRFKINRLSILEFPNHSSRIFEPRVNSVVAPKNRDRVRSSTLMGHFLLLY